MTGYFFIAPPLGHVFQNLAHARRNDQWRAFYRTRVGDFQGLVR